MCQPQKPWSQARAVHPYEYVVATAGFFEGNPHSWGSGLIPSPWLGRPKKRPAPERLVTRAKRLCNMFVIPTV